MSSTKYSPQTKSFIILFTLAVIGSLFSLLVSENLFGPGASGFNVVHLGNNSNSPVANASVRYYPDFKTLDTAGWKTYKDEKYGFSFSYKNGWKVNPGEMKDGFYKVEIDPGSKYYNMTVYVSEKGFYALDGLPASEVTINGLRAYNVSNLLYGIKVGKYFYTFDNGLSSNLINEFNTLVYSTQFR